MSWGKGVQGNVGTGAALTGEVFPLSVLVRCQEREMIEITILLKVSLGHAKCAHFVLWGWGMYAPPPST